MTFFSLPILTFCGPKDFRDSSAKKSKFYFIFSFDLSLGYFERALERVSERTWERGSALKISLLSSPSPQPLSPQSPQTQSQPSPTQFQPQKGQKGTGADTKILGAYIVSELFLFQCGILIF